ncbi:EI24 domain-containing protein [Phytomonospora sp. NPDC050363]|uniref:EI24 domain-containing protein n=1 Tax=Phytomonospora sp. NPDC050363 TaxID=3155642 RepID=UPI0033F95C5D
MLPTASPARNPSAAAQFANGFRLAARGLGMWARRPKLMLLGAIPALITLILFVVGWVFLLANIGDLSTWATGWAGDWSEGWKTTMEVIAGLAIVGVGALLTFLTYTAVTMIVGDPFYESISGEVEKLCGGVNGEVEIKFWAGIGRSVVEAVRLLMRTLVVALFLFVAGFIPFVGQTVIPVIGALVAGWFFTVSIVAVPFTRRGVDYTGRRKRLAQNRPLAVGFGTAYVLLFLIPGGAVLATPAAVAGGTLLAREIFGEPAVTMATNSGQPGRPPAQMPGHPHSHQGYAQPGQSQRPPYSSNR